MTAKEYIEKSKRLSEELSGAISDNLMTIKRSVELSIDSLNQNNKDAALITLESCIRHIEFINKIINPPHNPKP